MNFFGTACSLVERASSAGELDRDTGATLWLAPTHWNAERSYKGSGRICKIRKLFEALTNAKSKKSTAWNSTMPDFGSDRQSRRPPDGGHALT